MRAWTAVLTLFLAAGTAQAAESQSVHDAVGQPLGASSVGFGVASASAMTFADTSLALAFYFGKDNMLEGLVSMPGISPFQFTVGAIYKHTIARKQAGALHIGGGAVLGAAKGGTGSTSRTSTPTTITSTGTSGTAFLFSMAGIVGLHFPIASTGCEFHFDTGLVISVVDGNADLSIGGISSLLGAAILYRI